jgi:hypothetical protein
MNTACEPIEPSEMLDVAFRRMQDAGCGYLPVVRAGEYLGLLTLDHMAHWLRLRNALAATDGRRPRRTATGIA